MSQFTYTETYRKKSFKVILLTSILAGTLDAIAAIIHYTINGGKVASRIFQYIASGAVGGEAFTGGIGMVILGIILHYSIAFGFTLFFFLIYPRVKFFSKNKILTAAIYGIFVWLVMNFIVIPMSSINPAPFNLRQSIIGALILIVAIGLPLSFIIGKYYQVQKNIAD